MWRAIVRMQVRGMSWWFALAFAAWAGYILLVPGVLTGLCLASIVLSYVMGAMSAELAFRDSATGAPLMFSLPLSRRRMFLYRWTVCLGVQLAVLILAAFLLVSGARQMVQQIVFLSPWYPAVRFLELQALGPVAAGMLMVSQCAGFAFLQGKLCWERAMRSPDPWLPRLRRSMRLAYLPILACVWLGGGLWSFHATDMALLPTPWVVSAIMLVLAGVALAGSLYCYERIEAAPWPKRADVKEAWRSR